MTGEKTPKDENEKAKYKFIRAYFDELDRRIIFLEELFRNKHRNEALLLCCCYIEGLGSSLYWPNEGSCQNFVRVLKEYGEVELFNAIHPKQLLIGFTNAKSRKIKKIAEQLEVPLSEIMGQLYKENEIIEIVAPILEEEEIKTLKQNLWRGTYAAIAYNRVRCQLVHDLSALDVSFDSTTFGDKPVPNIAFPILYQPLKNIFHSVREISLNTATWFGHDFKET